MVQGIFKMTKIPLTEIDRIMEYVVYPRVQKYKNQGVNVDNIDEQTLYKIGIRIQQYVTHMFLEKEALLK